MFVAFLLVVSGASFADSREECEEACIELEDACYERCERSGEEDGCAEACQSRADACLEQCEE